MVSNVKDKLKKHYEATGRMFEADDLEPQPSKSYIKEINPDEKLAKEGKKAAAKEVDSMKNLGKKKNYEGLYRKGGSVSKRADGIAVKGKTRGRIV